MALIEHLKGRAAEAKLEELAETRNEIWEKVQSDWATRDFTGPAMPYMYPWEKSGVTKLDLPPGFDDAAGWADQKVVDIDRGQLGSELLATMPSPLSQSNCAFVSTDLADLVLPDQAKSVSDQANAVFSKPLVWVEPPTLDTVEPTGNALSGKSHLANDFIQRDR